MRRLTKEKTKEEIQLLSILEYIRDNPKPTVLPPALLQKCLRHLSIPEAAVPPDDFFLSDLMQHAVVELMDRALGTKSSTKALTGLIIIQLRYFDFLHRGCSINKALDAFGDSRIEQSVFELLCGHNTMAGRYMTMGSPEDLHLSWLKSASAKTAGRYADSAMRSIISLLGDCLSELFDLLFTAPAPEPPAVVVEKSEDVIDLPMLIHKYTATTCSLSPAAYGIQIPIAECVGRSVHVKREPHAIRSEFLPDYLANGMGTIAGLPGSGRTVLLQSIALLGNQKNLYACSYFLFSLRKFLGLVTQGYTLSQFIVAELLDGMPCSDGQRLQLATKVDELIAARRWVLLADDLECLDWASQELVIAKLACAPSVYFAITPWVEYDIHELMRCNRYIGEFVVVSLDDIDVQTRDAISRVAAKYMGIPYWDGLVEAAFDPGNSVEGKTALGILTMLKTLSVPADTKHLYFAYLFLNEILRRCGYPGLHFAQHPDNADAMTILLLQIARVVRDEVRSSDPGQPTDHILNPKSTSVSFGGAVASLFVDPIQQVLDRRVLMHRRSQYTAQFIFPAVEELLMTLDTYYFGYPTSFFDFLLLGNKSPLLQRVQRSVVHVPQLLGF
jgi:hypothetical protein